jgi:hypothetical protein
MVTDFIIGQNCPPVFVVVVCINSSTLFLNSDEKLLELTLNNNHLLTHYVKYIGKYFSAERLLTHQFLIIKSF